MPNRYLREAYIDSEPINKLSWQAEVLWTRLLVKVDDFGRCEANLKLLRPKLFPLRLDQIREADLSRCLAECEASGLIRLYVVGGKEYLQMMKWEKGRGIESKWPAPPKEIEATCFLRQGITRACRGKQGLAGDCIRPDSDTDNDSDTDSETNTSGKSVLVANARVVLALLNEATGKHFREVDSSLTPIMQRLAEPDVDVEGCKKMVLRQVALWKGDPKMAEYLRPETLFNKTKFNGYYAGRNEPVLAGKGKLVANHDGGF